ncbi:hypothetical protein [Rhodococcus koreensis]|uniref:hypothetical protein n=1 Tax=Rhodococcus koreensis TaxID=99653 RepID=UPI00366CC34F
MHAVSQGVPAEPDDVRLATPQAATSTSSSSTSSVNHLSAHGRMRDDPVWWDVLAAQ